MAPRTRKFLLAVPVLALFFSCIARSADAYIGPGAGFAFVSSFFILFLTFLAAFFVLVTWPVRWVLRAFRVRRGMRKSRTQRLVILGLDGQDPKLTEQYMEEGILPNFSKLAKAGAYRRLRTTLLSESPVAWSSFQTGCNPGKHKIFDFLVPNRKSHLPELSSAQIQPPTRQLKLGKLRIPLGKPTFSAGRKSQPFWKILGDHGIFSCVLRVPITFPPEKFYGVLLSAMCVPDLKGSQGTFFYYTQNPDPNQHLISGERIDVEVKDSSAESYIPGPENPIRPDKGEMRVPFRIHWKEDGSSAELVLQKKTYSLNVGEYTPWLTVEFKAGLGIKARGICRFLLLERTPNFRLYITPVQIDPEKPALPISHPFTYAMYLAKTQGPFATLGVAEDTSSLNERIVDEEAFLKQAYDIHDERERMYFDALNKTRKGMVVCVFDLTDRVQHMFMRFLDRDHPANRNEPAEKIEKYKDTIRKLYQDMDVLLGKTLEQIDDDTTLMVMSDHGFKIFRRGVNLNTWLYKNGFLHVKGDQPTGADMLQDIDWSKTQAYAVGFGGIYLNLEGREAKGIVKREEAEQVKKRIIEGLLALRDEEKGESPIREAYDAKDVFSGPYAAEGPDIVAGFLEGYRVSWDNVTGGVSEEIFEDNTRPWSGDHNLNPPDVPGILLCNREIKEEDPSILDIAPTALDLFSVAVPAYMDGVPLLPDRPQPSRESAAIGLSHKD